MLKKKIVMLGAFAVGKTSLVQRFVNSIFDEKYLTTIGVKIDQKDIELDSHQVTLMIWDLYGEDDFMKLKPSYLIGASGYFIIADGTRSETLAVANELHDLAQKTINNAPFILLINKSDLKEQWEIKAEEIEDLRKKGWLVYLTSAKEGTNVEEAFRQLTQLMIHRN